MASLKNPTAFRKRVVCGTEFVRSLKYIEFKVRIRKKTIQPVYWIQWQIRAWYLHPEDVPESNKWLVKCNLGNPFNGSYSELIYIEMGDCKADKVVQALKIINDFGFSQNTNYVKTVIDDRTVSIHNTIKYALPLFKRQTSKPKNELKKR